MPHERRAIAARCFGGGLRVGLADPGEPVSTYAATTRLGVDDGEQADVGQLQLARVDDLDCEDLVAAGEARSGAPIPRSQEVGHHHDHARGGWPTDAGREHGAGPRRRRPRRPAHASDSTPTWARPLRAG